MKTQDSIKKAADLLIKARFENKLITLPDELRPISIEEGYQIQDAFIEEMAFSTVVGKLLLPIMN